MGGVLALFFLAAGAAILIGLFMQVWVPAIQLQRFSRTFAGRPEAVEAFNRVMAIYGWRARLAVKLFKIPPPPDISA
jgi:hypothetical protein